MSIASLIRDVPDFPEPGIVYKDITPLLGSPSGFADAIATMSDPFMDSGVDLVVGTESRGFIFGVPIAQRLGVGFVPVRKPGKLPSDTHRVSYDLEYGSDALEIHTDAIAAGQHVLIVDDVLATGGTMAATEELVARCGGISTGVSVLIELAFLDGRAKLSTTNVVAAVGVA